VILKIIVFILLSGLALGQQTKSSRVRPQSVGTDDCALRDRLLAKGFVYPESIRCAHCGDNVRYSEQFVFGKSEGFSEGINDLTIEADDKEWMQNWIELQHLEWIERNL
jgi:hypothetical protein